jgi:glycosyltransferase involved in cell wall biosynthesis
MKTVSIFVITYNHEKFIAQAIESIVAQKVNFDYEIVIGEDFSKDSTRAICEEYARKYPGLITLLPSDKNYGPQGNTIRTLYACTGKYIALCEGDDYWTDDNKLQKQVDFLEAHPDFTICFSSVEIKDEMGWNKPDEWYIPKAEKDVLTIEDFILSEKNIVPTATIVFRNILPVPLPEFYVNTLAGDIGIQLFAADKGKAKYFSENTAAYRNHAQGHSKSENAINRGHDELMKLLASFDKYFNYRYHAIFKKRFLANAKVELIFNSKNKKGIDYLRYSDKIDFKELAYYHVVLFFPSLLKTLKRSKEH